MGVLSNLGYIKNASGFMCMSPDPILVIEAAAVAGTITLFNAITFSCLDILKLRAGVSPWHARGMRALVKGAIPGVQQDQAGKVLKFTIPLEKALFFFFVVDLTVDFFANWQSQIFKLGACPRIPDESNYSGPLATFVSPSRTNWARIAYAFTGTGPRRDGATSFIVPAGYSWQAQFSLNVKPIFYKVPVSNLQTRLRLIGSSGITIDAPPAVPDWFGNPVKSQIMFQSHKPTTSQQEWVFEGLTDADAIGIGGSAAYSIGDRPLHETSLIPVNCFGIPAPGTPAVF